MTKKALLLLASIMIAFGAAPAQADAAAVLESTVEGQDLTLSWNLIGEAEGLAIYWTTTDAQGSIPLSPTQTSITLANPEEPTAYVLVAQGEDTNTVSNPVSNYPRCMPPTTWVETVNYPPYVQAYTSCFMP